MDIFLISDIFGETPALEIICETLSQAVSGIQIIDPYNGINHTFETENNAYDYFMDRVGLKKYQSILETHLKSVRPDTIFIGFSVGASAIWGISHKPSLKHVKKAFCFYGSQIRHQAHINPVFDVELFFPKQEAHFDVDDLMNRMQIKSHVTCMKAEGLHGFMNELSPHFDPVCYAKFIKYLKTSLIQLYLYADCDAGIETD
jgi:dienelactone hydrolase